MPNAAVHILLARQVLERWESAPLFVPFAPTAATRNAFLHGAVAPDMGFFPGADPLISELAHHARTGVLCRALVEEARTDAELAFAWGWVTHVLADVAVHPLVNEACGEELAGSREIPLWGPAVADAHCAVEIGLDAFFGERPEARLEAPPRPAFGPLGARFLVRAYRRAYGAAPSARAFLFAHHRVCAASVPLALLRHAAGRAIDTRRGALRRAGRMAASAPLAAIAACLRPGSGARGLFAPKRPPPWLVREVEEIADGFADWFGGHFASGLVFLRDHCLDSGEVMAAGSPREAELLARLRGRAGSPEAAPRRAAA